MPPSAIAAEVRTNATALACLLPTLLILGGAVADLLAPEPYVGLPLLAAASLVGCAALPFRSGVAVAAASCLVSLTVDLQIGRPPSATLVDLGVVMVIGLSALWGNRTVSRQRDHLAVARDIAEAAQRAVLPSPPPRVGPLSVAARYEAAQAEARIGGDFYAVQETPFGVRAIVGDVVGKGMRAVPAVSAVVGTFREAAESAPNVGVLAQRLDHALERDCPSGDDGTEWSATALLVEIPSAGGTVTLLSRGHPAPFLIRDNQVTQLEPDAHDLPLGTGLPEAVSGGVEETYPLPDDAILLIVTDGVLEARDQHGIFYDPAVALARHTYAHPREVVDSLVGSVARWTGGEHHDDLAVLALARATASGQEHGAAVPARRAEALPTPTAPADRSAAAPSTAARTSEST